MVVYFFTKALKLLLNYHCTIYRNHLIWNKRRKLIYYGWLAITFIMGFFVQWTKYMPTHFTCIIVSNSHARLIQALSTVIIKVYMQNLAYICRDSTFMLHHLATTLGTFTINNTNNVQTMLIFSIVVPRLSLAPCTLLWSCTASEAY